ncbi:hypothetical protein FACS1894216_13990 [Synergistales bacterium]|nr:hypothetical protein FACS1894216_13990 [Synergistales bacterium]
MSEDKSESGILDESLSKNERELLDFLRRVIMTPHVKSMPERLMNDEIFNDVYSRICNMRESLRYLTRKGTLAKEFRAELENGGVKANALPYTAIDSDMEKWKLALDCSQKGVLDADIDGRRVFLSRRLWEMLKYSDSEENQAISMDMWEEMIHPLDREQWSGALMRGKLGRTAAHTKQSMELRVFGGDETHHLLGMNYIVADNSGGYNRRFIASCDNIGEQRKHEEMIQLRATRDQLTGLPNRYLYNDRLNQQMVTAKRAETSLILVIWDLDNFKEVNDTYGHIAGDSLLTCTAKAMASCLREMDTLARFGGDEFTMLLVSRRDHEEHVTQTILDRIYATLKEAPCSEYKDVLIHASCGVSFFPRHAQTADALFKLADLALYRAKRTGRNHAEIWSPDDPYYKALT